MILVDTSVWVYHLRRGNTRLAALLSEAQVLCHPFVIGELACGSLRHRTQILALLGALPSTEIADHEEVLRLVETKRLFARGVGWIDAHLVASALLTGCAVWTLDVSLRKMLIGFGLEPHA